MPKYFKAFRFDPQLYADFKEAASRSGYTVTGAIEKFMSDTIQYGLTFPSAKSEAAQAEARVYVGVA